MLAVIGCCGAAAERRAFGFFGDVDGVAALFIKRRASSAALAGGGGDEVGIGYDGDGRDGAVRVRAAQGALVADVELTQAEIAARAAGKLAEDHMAIDAAAEDTRKKYCLFDLQHKEYERTYAAATAWLADQAQQVPQCVLDDVVGNMTAAQAAQAIQARGDTMYAALDAIRSMRKAGKLAVSAGTKTLDQVVAELRAL